MRRRASEIGTRDLELAVSPTSNLFFHNLARLGMTLLKEGREREREEGRQRESSLGKGGAAVEEERKRSTFWLEERKGQKRRGRKATFLTYGTLLPEGKAFLLQTRPLGLYLAPRPANRDGKRGGG